MDKGIVCPGDFFPLHGKNINFYFKRNGFGKDEGGSQEIGMDNKRQLAVLFVIVVMRMIFQVIAFVMGDQKPGEGYPPVFSFVLKIMFNQYRKLQQLGKFSR